jgi:hypothetical protein
MRYSPTDDRVFIMSGTNRVCLPRDIGIENARMWPLPGTSSRSRHKGSERAVENGSKLSVSYFTLTASEAVVKEHLSFADTWRILMQYIQPRLFVGAFLISPPAGAEVATRGSNRMTSSVSPPSRST